MAKKKQKQEKKGLGIFGMLGLLIAVIVLILLLKSAFILVVFGTLPTLVAYYADTSHNSLGRASIASCNLAGVLPYVVELSVKGNDMQMLSNYLSNPNVWFVMYGLAALGYLLVKGCPLLYRYSLKAVNSSMVFQLEQKQDALVKEWGEDLKG